MQDAMGNWEEEKNSKSCMNRKYLRKSYVARLSGLPSVLVVPRLAVAIPIPISVAIVVATLRVRSITPRRTLSPSRLLNRRSCTPLLRESGSYSPVHTHIGLTGLSSLDSRLQRSGDPRTTVEWRRCPSSRRLLREVVVHARRLRLSGGSGAQNAGELRWAEVVRIVVGSV